MGTLKYKKGYKYQLINDFVVCLTDCPSMEEVPFADNLCQVNKFIGFHKNTNGYSIIIREGYAWDGATGAIDSTNFVRGSMVHDALLQAIGLGVLPFEEWKVWTDNFLIQLLNEDGMGFFRRHWVYWAVRLFGDPKGSQPKKIFVLKY